MAETYEKDGIIFLLNRIRQTKLIGYTIILTVILFTEKMKNTQIQFT